MPGDAPVIHYKTFVAGAWTNARAVVGPSSSHAAPAAFSLPDGRTGLVFIEDPDTGHARLRIVLGASHDPLPASLAGQRSGPFTIAPGSRLAVRGDWGATETVTFRSSDFAEPTRATPTEVVAAINARATHVAASVQSNGSVLLQSRRLGPDALLELDASQSAGTQSLGFDGRTMASGTWDDSIIWQPPQDVPGVAPGRHADPFALVDASGTVWIFWATHANGLWSLVNIRWTGSTWSAIETRAQGQGGNREPCAVLDLSNRIWLIWSRRQGVATADDTWVLRRMSFEPGTTTWSAEDGLTVAPVPRASDREPAAIREADGRVRVFFSSDRSGSRSLMSVTFTPGGPAPLPVGPIAPSAATDAAPAPVRMSDGTLWLLLRSDRNITLSRAARTASAYGWSSFRVPDAETQHRLVGTTTVVPTDLGRIEHSLQWDDLLAYTVQRPDGSPLADDERFTRGTIGLFVSNTANGRPLTELNVVRVRQLLDRFLPINVRAVIVFEPTLSVEEVYQVGADIGESYADTVPSRTFLG